MHLLNVFGAINVPIPLNIIALCRYNLCTAAWHYTACFNCIDRFAN